MPFHFDTDSVSQVGAGQITVTWKDFQLIANGPYIVFRGVVNCATRSITIREGWVTDPRTGRNKPLSESPSASGGTPSTNALLLTRFPTTRRPEGRMLRILCVDANGANDSSLAALAAELRAGWNCASASPTVPAVWCRNEPQVTDVLALAALRLGQASKVCGTSASELNALLASALSEIQWNGRTCASEDANCFVAKLESQTSEIGQDLAGAEVGGTCSNTERTLKLLGERQARDAAMAKFWSCVATLVRSYDDGTSPADSVATGVYGACQQSLVTPGTSSLSENPGLQGAVMPRIVASVLAERARKRLRPPQPKSKGATPTT